ncbi:serine O-acetyltransferase [Chloroflexota bacterium]
MFRTLREDIQSIFDRDPAARSIAEVFLCYPGLHALWSHRVSNFLWRHKLRLPARFLSHINRFFTGIEIHPGASIGRRFFIDHGAGIVVGETSEIGNDVLLYQGVVLGGTSVKKEKRHPTLGNNVEMGSGSIALGPIHIGDGARIGSGSVVVKSVPAGATVVGIPGRVVSERHKPSITDLEHGKLPDPVAEAIRTVLKEQDKLEERLQRLESSSGITSKDELKEKRKQIEIEFSQGEGI